MDSRRAGGGNRMMTSTTLSTNDMWSKTIGYDPHAAAAPEEAPEDAEDRERRAERDKGVMELARLATINQGGGNRGAPRRPPARHPRPRVAKPGEKKTPPARRRQVRAEPLLGPEAQGAAQGLRSGGPVGH